MKKEPPKPSTKAMYWCSTFVHVVSTAPGLRYASPAAAIVFQITGV